MEEILARVYTNENNEQSHEIYNQNIDSSQATVEKTMYTYMFGIDSISIKHVEQENEREKQKREKLFTWFFIFLINLLILFFYLYYLPRQKFSFLQH